MEGLWSRRTNSNKLSLSTSSAGSQGDNSFARNGNGNGNGFATFSKRVGGDSSSHGKTNPFNSIAGPPAALPSPTAGASAVFGLGSGAFAAFGGALKTPKSPAQGFDAPLGAAKTTSLTATAELYAQDNGLNGNNGAHHAGLKSGPGGQAAPAMGQFVVAQGDTAGGAVLAGADGAVGDGVTSAGSPHLLHDPWVFWIRPPISKANGYIAYDKTLYPIGTCETVEGFFAVYGHLKRPSELPMVSDYHLFKKGVRPVWEDEENKKGGKWIVRLKKGLIDRYWEDLLLAVIGDQFSDAGEEICGVVLSVRNGEDILSIWIRAESPRNLRIRDIMKQVLSFPQSTQVLWKSHDLSIQQRTAIEESRREKAHNSHHNDNKRSAKQQQFQQSLQQLDEQRG